MSMIEPELKIYGGLMFFSGGVSGDSEVHGLRVRKPHITIKVYTPPPPPPPRVHLCPQPSPNSPLSLRKPSHLDQTDEDAKDTCKTPGD